MPELYSDINKRGFFSAPQFTRRRHRYKGPRESEKVNLEIQQLNFSFLSLYAVIGGILNKIGLNGFRLILGNDPIIHEDDYLIDEELFDLAGLDSPIEYEGLLSLMARVDRLKKQVDVLETR